MAKRYITSNGSFNDTTTARKKTITKYGVLRTVTVVAAGGATGKSNPLYGCLGGCLRGQIG